MSKQKSQVTGRLKSEADVRQGLMNYAKKIGAEEDLKQLFSKWDRAIALAPPNEKEEMSKMAILEVQSLLDIYPEIAHGLTINDEVIIEAAEKPGDNILVPTAVKRKI